ILGIWKDLTIVNTTTGQQIYIERDTPDATPWLEINAGARSIYYGAKAKNILLAVRSRNTLTVTTTAAHGLSDGESVRLAGTSKYDGDYYPVTVTSTTQFTVELPSRHAGYGTALTGTVQQMVDLYNLTTFSDRERWLVLAPGQNDLVVTWNDPPVNAK